MVENKIIIKKPKNSIIGVIPINQQLLSNNDVTLKLNYLFLKKNKYFLSFEKNKNPVKTQIKDFFKDEFLCDISDKNINYFGKKGNILVYIVNFDNIEKLCGGNLNDYHNQNYSWKPFYNINVEKDNSNNNDDYNVYLDKLLISEKKKTKSKLERNYL